MRLYSTCTVVFLACILTSEAVIFWNRLFGLQSKEPVKRCHCSCGLPNSRKQRLVGGNYAQINEYPWTTGLLFKGQLYCGGTLISDRYVLTAAHCIHGIHIKSIKVIVGEHIKNFPIESHEKKYEAVYAIYHPHFNRSTYDNDIGLVKLGQKVQHRWYARPACLPRPNSDYVGEIGVVLGWGRQGENEDPSETLKEIKVPIFSNDVCRSLRFHPEEITDNMFCAGFVNGGTDSCHGDSGGPILWMGSDGKYDVIGIVSWGKGCGQVGYPGVYTRVTKYLPWIEEHTRDSCYCGRREGRRG